MLDRVTISNRFLHGVRGASLVSVAVALPNAALAQASPWLTGVNSVVANLQAWAAPLAVLAIMVLAILAMASRLSWGAALSVMLAIVLIFGAPQVVTWVRTMFAV